MAERSPTGPNKDSERLAVLDQAFRSGDFPPLGGGYSFAFYEGELNDDGTIPNREFAASFANYMVPIVKPDFAQWGHDLAHIDQYMAMMSLPDFAEIIQRSAARSVASTGAEHAKVPYGDWPAQLFATRIDKLGDSMRENKLKTVSDAMLEVQYVNLQRFILSGAADPDMPPAEHQALTADTWQRLGMPDMHASVLITSS